MISGNGYIQQATNNKITGNNYPIHHTIYTAMGGELWAALDITLIDTQLPWHWTIPS